MGRGYSACTIFNDKPSKFTNAFFVVENTVLNYLMRTLTQNELRYMLAILMTKNKFPLALQAICDRTGISKSKIWQVRDSLVKKGFIDYNPYGYIIVRYGYIRQLALEDEERIEREKSRMKEEELNEIEQELRAIGDLFNEEDIEEDNKNNERQKNEFIF